MVKIIYLSFFFELRQRRPWQRSKIQTFSRCDVYLRLFLGVGSVFLGFGLLFHSPSFKLLDQFGAVQVLFRLPGVVFRAVPFPPDPEVDLNKHITFLHHHHHHHHQNHHHHQHLLHHHQIVCVVPVSVHLVKVQLINLPYFQ